MKWVIYCNGERWQVCNSEKEANEIIAGLIALDSLNTEYCKYEVKEE